MKHLYNDDVCHHILNIVILVHFLPEMSQDGKMVTLGGTILNHISLE